jgi:D-alanine-D-alanine ligase
MNDAIEKAPAVDVLCGGRSEEHDISVLSAVAILNGLVSLTPRPRMHAVYIDREGAWFRSRAPLSGAVDEAALKALGKQGIPCSPSVNPRERIYHAPQSSLPLPDIFFPVLHGRNGEDGTVQGLFTIMDIPYVGSSPCGGACGMDKEIMRRLFESGGLPLLPWRSADRGDWKDRPGEIEKSLRADLKLPLFVKPSSAGSSIGVSRVESETELSRALARAFDLGDKVIVEQAGNVREIECAVLGNRRCRVSAPGEILPGAEFYDFHDKYRSGKSKLVIPAPLSENRVGEIASLARRAFRLVDARGLSRVDFFLCRDTGKCFVNEINTFPGFTRISMFPRLWEYSGVPFRDLLKTLLELGFENHSASRVSTESLQGSVSS